MLQEHKASFHTEGWQQSAGEVSVSVAKCLLGTRCMRIGGHSLVQHERQRATVKRRFRFGDVTGRKQAALEGLPQRKLPFISINTRERSNVKELSFDSAAFSLCKHFLAVEPQCEMQWHKRLCTESKPLGGPSFVRSRCLTDPFMFSYSRNSTIEQHLTSSLQGTSKQFSLESST